MVKLEYLVMVRRYNFDVRSSSLTKIIRMELRETKVQALKEKRNWLRNARRRKALKISISNIIHSNINLNSSSFFQFQQKNNLQIVPD